MSIGQGRWQNAEGRQLAESVLSRIAEGRDLLDLGLSAYEGRADLRGLTSQPGMGLGTIEFRGISFNDLDLSGCRLPRLRLFDCELRNCCFDDAILNDLRVWNSRITNCSFTSAALDRATFGGTDIAAKRCLVDGVDFGHAALTSASFNDVDVKRTDFSESDLIGAKFVTCGIESCRFAGELNEVTFDSRPRNGESVIPFVCMDLAAVRLDMCEFQSCEFHEPLFPADTDVLIVERFGEVAPRVLSRLERDESDAADDLRYIVEQAVTPLGVSPASTWIISMRDLDGWPSGEALPALARKIFLRNS